MTKPAMWTTEASEQGKAAILEAERQLQLRRSPLERTRDPLPEEREKLAELETALEVALVQVDAAKAAMVAALPRDVQATAVQISGVLSFNPPSMAQKWVGGADPDAYAAARVELEAAHAAEGKARGRLSDYERLVSAAGQARFMKAAFEQEGAA